MALCNALRFKFTVEGAYAVDMTDPAQVQEASEALRALIEAINRYGLVTVRKIEFCRVRTDDTILPARVADLNLAQALGHAVSGLREAGDANDG